MKQIFPTDLRYRTAIAHVKKIHTKFIIPRTGGTVWLAQQWNPGIRFALLDKPGSGTQLGMSCAFSTLSVILHSEWYGGTFPTIPAIPAISSAFLRETFPRWPKIVAELFHSMCDTAPSAIAFVVRRSWIVSLGGPLIL